VLREFVGTSFIPQNGHSPGSASMTFGWCGHVYTTGTAEGDAGLAPAFAAAAPAGVDCAGVTSVSPGFNVDDIFGDGAAGALAACGLAGWSAGGAGSRTSCAQPASAKSTTLDTIDRNFMVALRDG
jgi:hypothetical protein